MASPCWTPLKQAIVLALPECSRTPTSAGLVSYHLATNGAIAGTQLATYASTAVPLTLLSALEQSVITSQLPV